MLASLCRSQAYGGLSSAAIPGLALTNLAASMAGLALLSVSGISITISLLYCKRLQDCGIGADAVTAARYLLLILFAGTVVLWHGNFGGVDTPRQFTLLSAATTVFIVLPLYAYQLGIGRTTPLTAQVIRALGPVFVFAMESLADIAALPINVRFTPRKADIGQRNCDVRFVPKADSCTAAILSLFDHLVGSVQ